MTALSGRQRHRSQSDILAGISLSLWSVRQSVSACWSHYGRRQSRIIKASLWSESMNASFSEDRSQAGIQQEKAERWWGWWGGHGFSVCMLPCWIFVTFLYASPAHGVQGCLRMLGFVCLCVCVCVRNHACVCAWGCVKRMWRRTQRGLLTHPAHYPITTGASWQHSASHSWQTF